MKKKTQCIVLILLLISIISLITIIIFTNNKECFLKLKTEDLRLRNLNKHNRKNMIGSIPIYYINLERSKDRKEYMIEQFKDYKITNYIRIEGVDGKNIKKIGNNLYTIDGRNDYTFFNNFNTGTNSEIGCTLSHLLAIKTAYDNNEKNVLVFEDDASLGLLSLFEDTLEYKIKDLPKDCDILMLSTNNNKNIYNKKYILKNEYNYSATSYLITKTGIQKIINNYFKNNMFILDININIKQKNNDIGSDVYIYNACKTYILFPIIVYNVNYNLPSTIHDDHTTGHIKNSIAIINNYRLDS